MKFVRKSSIWVLGMLGCLSASSALVHAAQTTGEQAATQQGQSESVTISGTVLDTLPAADQEELQNSLGMLQEKYGDTLNQMVLEIQSGQLRVIGLNPDIRLMDKVSPSSA